MARPLHFEGAETRVRFLLLTVPQDFEHVESVLVSNKQCLVQHSWVAEATACDVKGGGDRVYAELNQVNLVGLFKQPVCAHMVVVQATCLLLSPVCRTADVGIHTVEPAATLGRRSLDGPPKSGSGGTQDACMRA